MSQGVRSARISPFFLVPLATGLLWIPCLHGQTLEPAAERHVNGSPDVPGQNAKGSAAQPDTYYVDPGGSDSNDGRSPTKPFKTVAKVNTLALQPGQRVLFKRGGVWRESLVSRSAGAPGAAIIFGSYGTGPLPVLTGADLTKGWTAETVSSPASARGSFTAYYTSLVSKPNQAFDNDNRMRRVQFESQLAPGSWWYDAGNSRIYVRTAGDSNPANDIIEVSTRDYPVYLVQHDVWLQGLDISKGNLYGIKSSPSAALNDVAISRCVVRDAFVDNIRFDDATTFVGPTITDSEVHGAGAVGILIAYANSGAIIRNNRVWANAQLSDNTYGGVPGQTYSAGIKVFGGATANYQAGILIERNTVYGNRPHPWVPSDRLDGARGLGIWLDTINITSGAPAVVRQNLVYDNRSSGIGIEVSRNCEVYYNVLYGNAGSHSAATSTWNRRRGYLSRTSQFTITPLTGQGTPRSRWWTAARA